jgi:DNA repair exonuclease SbcCD nuclease subunit
MTRHFLDQDAQAAFSLSRFDAIRAVGRLALERECEFVLVCGDVFESNHLNRQIVVRALDAMGSIQVPVYLLPGNHNPLDPGSVYRSPVFTSGCPANVNVIESNEPIEVATGVQLVGAPWKSKRPLTDLVTQSLENLQVDQAVVRVLAGHGAVDHLSPNPDDPALINSETVENALAERIVQYVALGDRHSFYESGESGRFNYSGAFEPTAFVEDDAGRVLVVEVDAESCQVDAVKVGTWAFIGHDFEVNDDSDLDSVQTWLEERPDKVRSIIRLAFNGTLGTVEKARLDSMLEHYRDLFASIQVWKRRTNLAVLHQDTDFSELGLVGFASKACDELISVASEGTPQSETATDALSLLYRLAGNQE